jgi:hypothetical protein
VATLATAGLVAVRAQQAPAPGVISGVVVDGSSGAPVAGAIVFIAAVPPKPIAQQPRQVTDDRGRFVFVNLPADTDYTIASSKFGYLDGGYGRDTRPSDPLRVISLAPSAWVQNIRAVLWKPGVIAGAVRDETGEPVAGIYVRLLVRLNIYGRSDLASGPVTVTDDRGEYRFSGLGPGRYLVQVPSVQATLPVNTVLPANRTPAPAGAVDVDGAHQLVIGRYPIPPPPVNGRTQAYGASFHPSTSVVEQASVIELGFAEERSSADIALTPVSTARVSGTVIGPPDSLVSLTLRLLPLGLENLGIGSEMATALVKPDGTFTFLNVPAGRYVLDAPNSVSELAATPFVIADTKLPAPAGREGWGMQSGDAALLPGVRHVRTTFRGVNAPYSGRIPVTVAGTDVSGLSLRLRPHVSMSGRVVIEPDPARPELKPPARFPIRLDSTTAEAHLGFPSSASATEPPEFLVPDISPGQFFVRAYGYADWLVKSVSWKGRDMTDAPFDTSGADNISDVVVTMTSAAPQLRGAVRDGDRLKADSSMIVLFPADRSRWSNTGLFPARLHMVLPSSDGRFVINRAPAGDYLLAAIDRSHIASWIDTDFLTRLERIATRVTLTWGGKTSQDLTVGEVR